MMRALRWLGSHLGSLVLALFLATIVWGTAVTSEDPDEVRSLPAPLPIGVVGLSPGLMFRGPLTETVTLTLRAPRSLWNTIGPDHIKVQADLSNLGTGAHHITLRMVTDLHPIRVEKMEPQVIQIVLEPPASRTLPIQVRLAGTPAPGFAPGSPKWSPEEAVLSGSVTDVSHVAMVAAPLDVDGLRADVTREVNLEALDASGTPLEGLTLQPATVTVSLPIQQQGGYRDVVVKAVIHGQQRSGYRLTGISVFPPLVTLFSSDPARVTGLPGYVETAPLDIADAQADVSATLPLVLPGGVVAVGNPTIFVQVGIAAIEDSVTVAREVRYQGLGPGLNAKLSPPTVDIIVSGPVPLLKALRPSDIDVYVDLAGLGSGSYQLQASYRVLLVGLRVEALLPAQVGVTLAPGPTATP